MQKKGSYQKIFPLILILFVIFLPSVAYSKEAKMENLHVGSDQKNIFVSFELKDGFTKDIEEAILSGIPTTFSFFIEIYKQRTLWPDKKVASLKFNRHCKYDPLKDEFEIFREENSQNYLYVKDVQKVKEVMTSADRIPVAPLFLFSKDETYRIRVKAELDTIDLPFPLNYLLFFVSFWDYETPWLGKLIDDSSGFAQVLPRN
jgi:hypothetical protein